MNVLLLNGSPHKEGNVSVALHEMDRIFRQEGADTEIVHIGNHAIRGCVACYSCKEKGACVFDVIASPVYYASANGTMISFLDRLFYSTPFDKTMKVGASVAAARRGGLSSTFDELNKYFFISGMPVAAGQYWNSVHGREAGEAAEDAEGLQGMRTLARNMVFLMRSIALGKEKYGLPEREPFIQTNFIR